MSDGVRAELAALEAASAPLAPDAEARGRLMALAVDHAEAFLTSLDEAPANRGWDDVLTGVEWMIDVVV